MAGLKSSEMYDAGTRSKRSCPRFTVELAVNFRWRKGKRGLQQGDGWTRNVSSRGICIAADIIPPVLARVEFDITLPPTELRESRRIFGEGEVCRMEAKATPEFAVRCDKDLRFDALPRLFANE